MNDSKEDQLYMKIAIEQAQIAEENGDVPIGAVIVYEKQIIGKACNQREQLQDPTAHAEIIALTQAAAFIESWCLHGCDDPKTGAVKSLYNIVNEERLNHTINVTSGVLAEECCGFCM